MDNLFVFIKLKKLHPLPVNLLRYFSIDKINKRNNNNNELMDVNGRVAVHLLLLFYVVVCNFNSNSILTFSLKMLGSLFLKR